MEERSRRRREVAPLFPLYEVTLSSPTKRRISRLLFSLDPTTPNCKERFPVADAGLRLFFQVLRRSLVSNDCGFRDHGLYS